MRAVVVMTIVLGFAPQASAQALAGEALVWQDAQFLLAPDPKADAVSFGAKDRAVGNVVQMKVVGETGDFVELAPHTFGSGCLLWSELDIDGRLDNVHLFVRRGDLAPVLAKPWSATYADGTRLSLFPGEPISGPERGGTRTIALSRDRGSAPVRISVAVPDDAVGLSFTAHPGARPKGYDTRGTWEVTTRTVTLDGKPVALDGRLPLFTDKMIEYRGARAMLAIDDGCEKLLVAVPKQQVRAYKPERDDSMGAILTGDGDPEPGRFLPRGTPLSTPAGRRIAVARWNIAVGPSSGAQTCVDFDVKLAGGNRQVRKLALCAPTSAVRTAAAAPPPPPPPLRAASLAHGKVDTVGDGLDAAIIRKHVKRAESKLRACYEASGAGKRGTITVTFQVNGDGRANPVGATGMPGVDACIADVIRAIAFPKPSGPTGVTYPIAFE
ncbi:MAG: energy transducer TonB [Deltaproteobacteria bacterium]|nr:energy transducer TonB [Deltaproteobacteria bacterium]